MEVWWCLDLCMGALSDILGVKTHLFGAHIQHSVGQRSLPLWGAAPVLGWHWDFAFSAGAFPAECPPWKAGWGPGARARPAAPSTAQTALRVWERLQGGTDRLGGGGGEVCSAPPSFFSPSSPAVLGGLICDCLWACRMSAERAELGCGVGWS